MPFALATRVCPDILTPAETRIVGNAPVRGGSSMQMRYTPIDFSIATATGWTWVRELGRAGAHMPLCALRVAAT
jgi:hypothetical protein